MFVITFTDEAWSKLWHGTAGHGTAHPWRRGSLCNKSIATITPLHHHHTHARSRYGWRESAPFGRIIRSRRRRRRRLVCDRASKVQSLEPRGAVLHPLLLWPVVVVVVAPYYNNNNMVEYVGGIGIPHCLTPIAQMIRRRQRPTKRDHSSSSSNEGGGIDWCCCCISTCLMRRR